MDRGEEASLLFIANQIRGLPVLDLGIGVGRTTSLLLMVSDDYTGIDYSQTMVQNSRLSYPDVDIRHGDARDLADYPRGHYGLIMFSYNGIDSVVHDERQTILAHVSQALAPGGYFVFSTLNLHGPWFDERPWRVGRASLEDSWSKQIRGLASAVRRDPFAYLRTWMRWGLRRDAARDFGIWGIGALNGPGSGLVVHWTTPPGTLSDLQAAELELVALFNPDGTVITPDGPAPSGGMFHVVARRPKT